MAQEIKRPESEAITFAEMPAKKTVRTDGSITVSVNNKDYFDKLGIDPAVRKEVTEKVDEMVAKTLKATSELSLKNDCANVEVRLGQGAFSMVHELKSKYQRGGLNPATKKPFEPKYGQVTSTFNMPYGKAIKVEGGLLEEIEKDHEKAHAKKK
jgi:hypothetical protein